MSAKQNTINRRDYARLNGKSAISTGRMIAIVAGLLAVVGIVLGIVALTTGSGATPAVVANDTLIISAGETPAVIRESGQLPTGKNFFIIKKPGRRNNASIDVTLPADLTPYVGRRITVCAVGRQYATLTLNGGSTSWLDTGYWPVAQFGSPNAEGDEEIEDQPRCCITFDVLTPISVNVISYSTCTSFCTAFSQFHCVNPMYPALSNGWHGWWRNYGKSFLTVPESYMFIDMTKTSNHFTVYGGSVVAPREETLRDFGGPLNDFTPYLSLTAINVFSLTAPPFPFDLVLQRNNSMIVMGNGPDFHADANGRWAVGAFGQTPETSNIVSSWIKVPAPSFIIPKSTGRAAGDVSALGPDDPVNMFSRMVEHMLVAMAVTNTQYPATSFIGQPAAQSLATALKTSTITHSTPVTAVIPTYAINLFTIPNVQAYFDQYGVCRGTTTFETAVPHNVVPGSISVTISGFTGTWAAANGVHKVSIIRSTYLQETDTQYHDYSSNPAQSTVRPRVVVFLDTSNTATFPRLANGRVNLTAYGTPTITVSYGPLTGASEYRRLSSFLYDETVNVMEYWRRKAFKQLFHSYYPISHAGTPDIANLYDVGFNSFVYQNSGFFSLSTNTFEPIGDWYTIARHLASTDYFYSMQYRGLYRYDSTSTFSLAKWAFAVADATGRFGIRPDADNTNDELAFKDPATKFYDYQTSTYEYNTVQNNYLTGSKLPAWKMTGTSRATLPNFYAQFYYPGGEGDEFDTILIGANPMTDPIPQYYSYFSPRLNDAPAFGYPPYSADPVGIFRSNDVQYAMPSVGFIKSSVTPANLTIGYLNFASQLYTDPFLAMVWPNFCPTGMCTNASDVRNWKQPVAKALSVLMKYLVDGEADHIIIDIRGDVGGILALVPIIRQFFGTLAHTPIRTRFTGRQQLGVSKLIDSLGATYTNPNIVGLTGSAERTDVDYSSVEYPDSHFFGGNVVILTDTNAGSSGDLFPSNFLGPNMDRQLGGSTEAKIVGSLDGRLQGANVGAGTPFGVSEDSPRCTSYADGQAISCLPNYPVETGQTYLHVDNTPAYNRPAALRLFNSTGIANRVVGLNGGYALPADWERNVYPALGYVPNPYPVLPGWTHPQTPLILSVNNPLLTATLANDCFSITGNVLTVTSLAAHGYSVGDSVAINGGGALPPVANIGSCNGFSISKARPIASVPSATTFTISLGSECDVGGTPVVSDNTGVIVEIKNRAQWRDHWLEQAIRVAIAGGAGANPPGAKRKAPLRRQAPKSAMPAKRTLLTPQTSTEQFGQNILCPANRRDLLTDPQSAPFGSLNVTVPKSDPRGENDRERKAALKQLVDYVHAEIMDGGLCVEPETGKLKATASFRGRPRVTHESDRERPQRPDDKKRTLKK